MPSSQQVAEHRRTLERVRDGAVADVATLWGRVVDGDADVVKRRLAPVLPRLVNAWGDVASTVTADVYEAWRADSVASGSFSAGVADPIERGRVDAMMRWALGPMFGSEQDMGAVVGRLTGSTDRFVMGQSDETMALNVRADRARFAWVPSSSDVCAWCAMQASRGAEFRSSDVKRHDDCRCSMVPSWSRGADLPSDYDQSAWKARYRAAVEAAGSADTRRVLAELRAQAH